MLICFTLLMTACGGGKDVETQDTDPGPVSESDKSRYNLNSTDEPLYGTTDTLKQDSLEKADSLNQSNP